MTSVPSVVGSDCSVLPAGIVTFYGCRNCLFRLFDDCPSGHSSVQDSGLILPCICDKQSSFLSELYLSCGEDESEFKERYHLLLQELESLSDYKEYCKVRDEVLRIRSVGGVPPEELLMRMNGYKLWWSRLSENLVKGLSKVSDRHSRKSELSTPKLTIQNLNILLSESIKKLKDSSCVVVDTDSSDVVDIPSDTGSSDTVSSSVDGVTSDDC